MFRRGTKRPFFSVGGHTSFDHDDSSNHSGAGIVDYDDESSSQQQGLTTNSSDSSFVLNQFGSERPRRVQKSITKLPPDDNTNLNACLDHLLRILSRKDKEGFFQYPVTDQFAPGYSQIITRPMDFSTMKKKINQDDYTNILEFRADFELMCENAMKYNRPDTIYWQAAKKLLAVGTKLMHKEKLISFRRSLECFSRLTERELGFRIESSTHTNEEHHTVVSIEPMDSSINDHENASTISLSDGSAQRKPKLILKLPKYYDKAPLPIPDEDDDEEYPPEVILSQARQAAQTAREKLSLHRSICSYTVAYQRANNITSLRFTNQDDFSQNTVAFGDLINVWSNDNDKSSNVSTLLPVVGENDKRSHLTVKEFLDNGPFSSNAAQPESLFSSMPKEDLDLLTHTYGSEFSAQYAVSLMEYVKDAGDLALAYVDRFLSVLTNGEHDNFILKRKEKQQKVDEDENKIPETNSTDNLSSNDSALVSSSDQVKLEPQIINDTNQQIDDNAQLFMQLGQTQFDHLSQSCNQLHQMIPSQQNNETSHDFDLTDKVLFNFNDLSSLSNGPDKLISSESIQHNLGIMSNNETSLSTFDTL